MKKAKLILVCVSWLVMSVITNQPAMAEQINTEDFIQFTASKSQKALVAAKFALESSASEEIKTFAQRMLEEQSEILSSLESLAQKEGIRLDGASQRGAYVFIRKGETFETAYANKRTVELKRMVRVMRKAIFSDNASVRHYAEQTLPVLMRHWYQSQRLVLALQNPSAHANTMVATR